MSALLFYIIVFLVNIVFAVLNLKTGDSINWVVGGFNLGSSILLAMVIFLIFQQEFVE